MSEKRCDSVILAKIYALFENGPTCEIKLRENGPTSSVTKIHT